MFFPDIIKIFSPVSSSIRELMLCIDANAKGMTLVVDEQQRLVDTITDGDIRRAILSGMEMTLSVQDLIAHKATVAARDVITAVAGSDHTQLITLMSEHGIHHVPIVDDDRRVIDLVTMDDLVPKATLPIRAVVMAGGFGNRLGDLTQETPKPMLPLGDRPILEHIIEQLKDAGIEQVSLTTHYMPEKITDHFGDGSDFGIQISYVQEDEPLGTAGALGQIGDTTQPLFIMNGDIITDLDIKAMLTFHKEHDATLTVGVRQYDLNVPFGVIEGEGLEIVGIKEKPVVKFDVAAGIYLLEPSALEYVDVKAHMDMPELIQRLVKANKKVISFLVIEYWLDIGDPQQYAQAQLDVINRKDIR